MKNTYLLFEMASGYALFLCKEMIQLDQLSSESAIACRQFGRFRSMVNLVSFAPFTSADQAIENVDAVSKGQLTPFLANFLRLHLSGSKKDSAELGVADVQLGQAIKAELHIACVANDTIFEMSRWIRFHAAHFIPELKEADIVQAQLGLAHGFSRILVKMNVNRSDNMIIQAISLLDQMDKDINTFAMRVKEWYGWHFPELKKLIADNEVYCKLCIAIKDKRTLSNPGMEKVVADLTGDEAVAAEVVKIAAISMGMDFTEADFQNIETFAGRVSTLSTFRKSLFTYLTDKMNVVAPNLAALIGEQIGGRLISQAGSLTNLAKYPASTVQILGAEKALFRALKNKTNTPKYGLIFHSTYIGKAAKEHKGRISRYLANKASIASRLDCFMEEPNRVFGEILAQQVEDRLVHLDTGKEVETNEQVMEKAVELYAVSMKRKLKKNKKRSAEEVAQDDAEVKAARKEEKKAKKAKHAEPEAAEDKGEKKKKSKKGKHAEE